MKKNITLLFLILFFNGCRKQDVINPTILKSPNVQIFPITKYVGDPTFQFEFKTLSNAPIKLTSSNLSVATINKDSIKILSSGTSKIEVVQDANEIFSGITLSTDLNVKNRLPVIISKVEPYIVYLSDGETKLPIPKSNSLGLFTYSSSNQTIAQVSGVNLKPLKVGKVKITAFQQISGDFGIGQTDFEVEVKEKIDFSGFKIQTVYTTKLKDETITDFFIDNENNIIFSSYVRSASSGKNDYFISKIDKSGNQIIIAKDIFQRINSIEPDSKGNIFVADGEGNRIYQLDKNYVLKVFAGNGSTGSNDGAGTVASFNFPVDLKFDNFGDLLVSDNLNHTIRRIKPDGLTSTVAGIPKKIGSFNGDKTIATFFSPSRISINNENEIFVADGEGKMIRKIDNNGIVSTFLGSLNAGNNDGNINSASFYAITDLNHTKNNILLIGDFKSIGSPNYGILRYSSNNGILSTALNIKFNDTGMLVKEIMSEIYLSDRYKIYKLVNQ